MDLFDNCAKMVNPGNCSECSTGYVVTGSFHQVCCSTGEYLDYTSSPLACETNPTSGNAGYVDDCSIYLDQDLCD